MKYTHSAGAGAGALLALVASSVVSGDSSSDCYEEKGNWYCSQVDAISYSNFGTAGQYQKVIEMGSTGQCEFAAQTYQGGMAPLDEEVSWHFRGPIRLKQFAFYTLGTTSETKRSIHPSPHQRRQAHAHAHDHLHHQSREDSDVDGQHVDDKRGVGDWVTAVIDGKTVSWINEWSGVAATAAPAVSVTESVPSPVASSSPVGEDWEDWVTAGNNEKTDPWINPWSGGATTSVPAVVSPVASSSVDEDWITAVINGKTVSWINPWSKVDPTSAPAAVAPASSSSDSALSLSTASSSSDTVSSNSITSSLVAISSAPTASSLIAASSNSIASYPESTNSPEAASSSESASSPPATSSSIAASSISAASSSVATSSPPVSSLSVAVSSPPAASSSEFTDSISVSSSSMTASNPVSSFSAAVSSAPVSSSSLAPFSNSVSSFSVVVSSSPAASTSTVEDWITAVIDGKTVSWTIPGSGIAATSAPSPSPTTVTSAAIASASSSIAVSSASTSVASASASASVDAGGSGEWSRQAYYDAEQGVADGLVFLNNHGGEGSGVFDTVWGMSLSYASADNTEGSASPVTLADTLIPDDNEFLIMTDKSCSDGGCGTVRDGTVAYHGFDGASKLFLLEFSMPLSGTTGFNADMPAVWILNAQIPRTEEYGSCSCWESGCGEFDIFEVLDSGNQKCKSSWHGGGDSLGDSHWFQRPINETKKAAVVLDGSASTAHIFWLPDDTDFATSLSTETVTNFLASITDPNLNIKDVLGS